jgi:hypothetical protein
MPQGCVQQSTVPFGGGSVEIHWLARTGGARLETCIIAAPIEEAL